MHHTADGFPNYLELLCLDEPSSGRDHTMGHRSVAVAAARAIPCGSRSGNSNDLYLFELRISVTNYSRAVVTTVGLRTGRGDNDSHRRGFLSTISSKRCSSGEITDDSTAIRDIFAKQWAGGYKK